MIRRKSSVAVSTLDRSSARDAKRANDERLLAENDALRRLLTLQERLFERAIGDGDITSLVESLSHLIGRPVGVVGLGSDQSVSPGRGSAPRLAASAELAGLTAPIVVDHEIVGHLIVSGTSEPSDSSDRLVLGGAARIIAMLVHRVRATTGAASAARQQILADLLGGNRGSDVEVRARGVGLGCDLSRPRCLFVIEATDAFSDDGSAESVVLRTIDGILVAYSAVVGSWRGRGVAAIFSPLDASGKSTTDVNLDPTGLAEQVRSILERTSPADPPIVAVASGFPMPFDGPRTFTDAIVALGLARRLGRTKTVIRVDDRDLKAYQLLADGHDEGRAREFIGNVLGRLESHDASRASRFVETLEAYLDHNGSLEPTAAALFIHVSTLKYRLSRIAEISRLSLHDPRDRFHAQFALRLRRLWQSDVFVRPS